MYTITVWYRALSKLCMDVAPSTVQPDVKKQYHRIAYTVHRDVLASPAVPQSRHVTPGCIQTKLVPSGLVQVALVSGSKIRMSPFLHSGIKVAATFSVTKH